MLKKLLKMLGIKSRKEKEDQKKGPIQSKTGPATKQHKKKIVSGFPEENKPREGHSPRYKGNNARPERKPQDKRNKPAVKQEDKGTPAQGKKQTHSNQERNQERNQGSRNTPHKRPVREHKPEEKKEIHKPAAAHKTEQHDPNRVRVPRPKIKVPELRPKRVVSNSPDEETKSMGSEIAEDISKAVRVEEKTIRSEEKAPRLEDDKKKTHHHRRSVEEEEKKTIDDNFDPSTFIVPEVEGKVRFQDFDLPKPLMHAIADNNFQYCTPIQQEVLSKTLNGKDAVGQAQTGTGKTAAFLITILSRLTKEPILEERKPGAPRALIMAPTRELVMQIFKDAQGLSKYMDINIQSVFGGMDYNKQRSRLHAKPVDVIIATPGRLIDFYNRKELFLNKVEILVIDEADRMLDMGFIPDVKKIVRATPIKDKRQTLFFSATIDNDVMHLSQSWTTDSLNVKIEPDEIIVKNIEQIFYTTTSDKKYPLLYNLITKQNLEKVMVFTNRRDEARDLGKKLYANGIECDVLSGEVLQKKRVKTLEDFRNGIIKVLVATDVAGRGIHIESISHVINYTLPEDPEDYVHRVGRTGRAGASGISISFATEDDAFAIPAIEEYVGKKFIYSYPADEDLVEPPAPIREAQEFAAADKAPVRKNNFSGKPPHRRGPRPPRRDKPSGSA